MPATTHRNAPVAVMTAPDTPSSFTADMACTASSGLRESFDTVRARVEDQIVEQLGPDQFEARVSPLPALQTAASWSAYWTITEHGHNSKVQAGENAGEFLKHDFVVRQYTPVGRYRGAQMLPFTAIAAQSQHPRQINLVVTDTLTGKPLQALSLACG